MLRAERSAATLRFARNTGGGGAERVGVTRWALALQGRVRCAIEWRHARAERPTLEALSLRDVREAQRLLDTALQLSWITPRFIESALILRHERGQHVRALARLHSLARGGTQSQCVH